MNRIDKIYYDLMSKIVDDNTANRLDNKLDFVSNVLELIGGTNRGEYTTDQYKARYEHITKGDSDKIIEVWRLSELIELDYADAEIKFTTIGKALLDFIEEKGKHQTKVPMQMALLELYVYHLTGKTIDKKLKNLIGGITNIGTERVRKLLGDNPYFEDSDKLKEIDEYMKNSGLDIDISDLTTLKAKEYIGKRD